MTTVQCCDERKLYSDPCFPLQCSARFVLALRPWLRPIETNWLYRFEDHIASPRGWAILSRGSLAVAGLGSTSQNLDTGERAALFIALEGIDGAGKSTQCALLAHAMGATAVWTPGRTAFGALVRTLVLGEEPSRPQSARATALLFAADLVETAELVIKPAMEAGQPVVCDRFLASAIAYQSPRLKLPPEQIEAALTELLGTVIPTQTVLLDLTPIAALRRLAERDEGQGDQFQRAPSAYKQQVYDLYLQLAQRQDWIVVDASGAVPEVHAEIVAQLHQRGISFRNDCPK